MRYACLAAIMLLSVGAPAARSQSPDEQARVIEMIHAGSAAMAKGDLPSAERQFKQATAAAPGFSDAFLALGLVQVRRGELNTAVASLTRATELNPRLPGAHLFLGIAQYQLGNADQALGSLRTATEVQPRSSEAFLWLGIVLLHQEQPEQATVALDQALALSPKEPRVLYYAARAHMLTAQSEYRQLSQLDPNSALVHRGLAESEDMGGQPEKSIAEYELAVKQDPTNPDLYEALGEEDLKMSRRDAAQQAYEHALALNPFSVIALYNLGRIDVESGKPEQGVALLRKAASEHADAAPTDFYLGLGLSETGVNAEAAQWLEHCLASQPSEFIAQSAYYQLARVYKKLNRSADAQKALAELTRLKAGAAQKNTERANQAQASAAAAAAAGQH
jgi:tetratricopeptide (TPR) repeat protein